MKATAPSRSAKIDLTSGSLAGHLIRMAWPAAFGIFLQSLYSMVDTLWLGRMPQGAVVGVVSTGVARPVLFMSVAAGFGLGIGGMALVSQYTGAGQHRQADHSAGQTMLLLSGMGALSAAVVIALAPCILWLMRVPADVRPSATVYLRLYMLGMPFMTLLAAYGSVLRALGDTITVVVIGVVANLLNFALDPLLIFGIGGFPAMGVAGAALASAICQAAGALGCYLCMARGRAGLHVEQSDFAPDWPVIRRIVAVGVPAGIASGIGSVGFAVFQTIVNSFGTAVVGGFTIGFQVMHLFDAPTQAMAQATAPVVGQALGAGKVALARRAVRLSVSSMALAMLVPTVFLMLGGQWVARLFVHDAGVIAETARFFRIVPASTYFFGVTMVLMGAFYGSGHTRPAMAVSLVRMFGIRIPGALFLAFVVGLGSSGVYAGMVAGNVAGALLALYLFLKGGWEKAVIAEAAGDDQSSPAGEG